MTTSDASTPATAPAGRETFSRWRLLLSRLNLLAIVTLTIYILVVMAIILFFYPRRIDLTVDREHTLSEATRKRLELVEDPVRVVIPIFFQEESELSRIQKDIFVKARTLLDQYLVTQPRIRIEHELNLLSHADSVTWQELQQQHDLTASQINSFIFITGPDGEYRQVVTLDDLAIYDRPKSRTDPVPAKIHRFLGEEAFTTALTRLIRKDQKKIYFSSGHGEIPLGETTDRGLSYFHQDLLATGYEVARHSLQEDGAIPPDCDLYILASPSRTLDAVAREHLNDYLLEDGRLLVTLSPVETELEKLLAEWGVTVEPGRALQRRTLGQYSYWSPVVSLRTGNVEHPITRDFRRSEFYVEGHHLRPLTAALRKDDFSGEWLYRSALEPKTFIDGNRNGSLDPGEMQGQVIGAVTVSKPIPDNPPPGYEVQRTRLVVMGDGSPLTNAWYNKYSHRPLVQNTVRWLAGLENELAGSEGREWSERTLKWSPGIHRFLFWVPIFVIPGVVLVAGVLVFLVRRS